MLGAFLAAATVGLLYYGEFSMLIIAIRICQIVHWKYKKCSIGTKGQFILKDKAGAIFPTVNKSHKKSMNKSVVMVYLFLCVFAFMMIADAILMYSGGELTVTGPSATAGIFATYPADYLSVWGGVVDQVRYCHSPFDLTLTLEVT